MEAACAAAAAAAVDAGKLTELDFCTFVCVSVATVPRTLLARGTTPAVTAGWLTWSAHRSPARTSRLFP